MTDINNGMGDDPEKSDENGEELGDFAINVPEPDHPITDTLFASATTNTTPNWDTRSTVEESGLVETLNR